MLEAIRIRKAGYAVRVTMQDFTKRYRAILGPKVKVDVPNPKLICEQIFKELLNYPQYKKVLDPAQKRWQIGSNKVFLKEDVRTTLEQAMGVAVL